MKMFTLNLITQGGRVVWTVGAINAADEASAFTKLGLHRVEDRLEFRDYEQAVKILDKTDAHRVGRKIANLQLTETSNLDQFDLARGSYSRDPDSARC